MTTKDYTEFAFTLPDLIEIQRASFRWFLEAGLIEELDSFSPITDYTGKLELHFLGKDFKLKRPKYDVDEAKRRDSTYSVQMYVPTRLINKETGEIKEQEVFIGDLPLMTERGTFIINGAERVIVNQIVRSPGVYYKSETDKNGRRSYNASLIPNRGAWLKFETDKNDLVWVRIDKTRKLSAQVLLKALGLSDNEVYDALRHPEYYQKTLEKEGQFGEEEALMELYRKLRPGEPPTVAGGEQLLNSRFFDPKRYDLGRVGRYKLNKKLRLTVPDTMRVLTSQDILTAIDYLINLEFDIGSTDDIDHLGNRRVRSVGELLQNQVRVGLNRLERIIRERMTVSDADSLSPASLVNPKPLVAAIKEFFGSSQLSQFMDQTNPLAELTHKRRLSALGPGGLTRERAGFEVRDVHYSQYGRMFPIETPEGPNIGLITSLACYARVNDLGFVETPYRVVKNGKVTNEIAWLDANREEDAIIAQANATLNPDGTFVDELVLARQQGDVPLTAPNRIDYMDVAPEQLVSIAAALIPFLEHDDANRALMGSNMQRQAVPLLNPKTPVVGTGLEEKVAKDSGAVVIARRSGVVTRVTADEIIVDAGPAELKAQKEEGRVLARLTQHDRYRLRKYWRTNQDTAINQRPLVKMGQAVKKGDVLADGAATEMGQLALGSNVTVAFMPWYGHNFEDAIVLSERLVKDDVYSSIHIQELELHVRDTKRGQEEITREIPNVSEEALLDLDERGIVRIGAHVKPGDILVGKITPKGETELSPEEKLLTAIFGEKAKDVKDSSLKVPPGMEGVVIDVKIFSRVDDQVVEKDRGERIGEIRRLEGEEKIRIGSVMMEELGHLLEGQEVALMLKAGTVEEYLPSGSKLTAQG